MVAQIRFEGEYKIGDGEWQEIIEGKHIPATKGDVTLRGNFHMFAPDGEYVGIYSGDLPIALYTNHINLTIFGEENEPYMIDAENPLYEGSACGKCWTAHLFPVESEEPVEILIHNPHSFGNERAIDEMISNFALWSGINFEREVLSAGQAQRNTGLFFVIIAFVLLGSALFSALLHIQNNRIIWLLGITILTAGIYLAYSAFGVSFWSESIVTNTTVLALSMIFYMLLLSIALVYFLKSTKPVGILAVTALGTADLCAFLLPVLTDLYFYDTWLYWASLQLLANVILLGCLVKEFFVSLNHYFCKE